VHAIHEGCPSSPVFSAAVDFSMATSNNLQQPGAATVQEGDSYAGALWRDSETASKVHRVAMPKPSAEQSYNVVDAVMDYLDTLSPGGSTTGMEAVHPSELEAVVECETFECALDRLLTPAIPSTLGTQLHQNQTPRTKNQEPLLAVRGSVGVVARRGCVPTWSQGPFER
jgi:hypothetical protein